jgi:hypothetical protein
MDLRAALEIPTVAAAPPRRAKPDRGAHPCNVRLNHRMNDIKTSRLEH